jgi:hypothetical protein
LEDFSDDEARLLSELLMRLIAGLDRVAASETSADALTL